MGTPEQLGEPELRRRAAELIVRAWKASHRPDSFGQAVAPVAPPRLVEGD